MRSVDKHQTLLNINASPVAADQDERNYFWEAEAYNASHPREHTAGNVVYAVYSTYSLPCLIVVPVTPVWSVCTTTLSQIPGRGPCMVVITLQQTPLNVTYLTLSTPTGCNRVASEHCKLTFNFRYNCCVAALASCFIFLSNYFVC